MGKQFLLQDIAEMTSASLLGNPKMLISGISDLESAEVEDISFLSNPKYAKLLPKSKAGAIFIPPHIEPTPGKNFLVVDNPSQAFQKIVELLLRNKMKSGFSAIHKTAVIHPDAKLGQNVEAGPNAVIDANAIIGDGTVIGANCCIGPYAVIGKNCKIHPNVTIREGCILSDRVIIQPGAVIGSCGFGYTTSKDGIHEKINQLGIVHIEEDVEIGANTTIDRARFKETRIGKGSKIDNLVMIAHGVNIGPHNLILAQVGIAGSSSTGSHVILAGQVGVVGHVSIPGQTMVAAKSGISKSLPQKGSYSSAFPAMEVGDFNRMAVHMRRLDSYVQKIKELEAKISRLEEKLE